MAQPFVRLLGLILATMLVVAGCNFTNDEEATEPPASLPVDNTAPSDWPSLAPGVEYQSIPVVPYDGISFDMQVVRIDPAQARFEIHYSPGQPFSLDEWYNRLENPIVVINGGLFTPEHQALGLVVIDGQASGRSFPGFGGMFQIDQAGAVRLRSLVSEPYEDEALTLALQSFPMLIEPGGFPARTDEGFETPSRRSVIAQDRQGRILLMVTDVFGTISFAELQSWLLESGLEVNIAFALDGGRSTGIAISRPDAPPLVISALSDLPLVLAVYGR